MSQDGTIGITRSDTLVVRVSDDTLYLYGLDIVLPGHYRDSLQARNLSVEAEVVTLTESISLPGRNVRIVCRDFYATTHQMIDTSGLDGDAHPIPAADGQSAGAHGEKGIKGNPGGNAGSIHLAAHKIYGDPVLVANGGRGGDGQDGGTGAVGATGRPGHPGSSRLCDDGSPGGRGGKGGNAGPGGDGGDGGNAGTIVVITDFNLPEKFPDLTPIRIIEDSLYSFSKTGGALTSAPPTNCIDDWEQCVADILRTEPPVEISAEVGTPGQPGKNGDPGDPGIGGSGGKRFESELIGGREFDRYRCVDKGRHPNGPLGEPGNPVSAEAMPRAGRFGESPYRIKPIRLVDGVAVEVAPPPDDSIRYNYWMAFRRANETNWAAEYSGIWIQRYLLSAELDYIREDRQTASERLVWMHRILNGSGSALVKLTEGLAPVRDRVSVLIAQIASGVDFYGYVPGHVPLTSLKFFRGHFDRVLVIVRNLADADREFWDRAKDNQLNMSALRSALNASSLHIETLSNEQHLVSTQISEADSEITALLGLQEALARKIQDADAAFNDALSRKAGGCGLSDLLKAAAAVATIISGGQSIAAGLAGAASLGSVVSRGEIEDTFEGKAKFLAKELKESKGGFNDLQTGYDKFRSVLSKDPDAVKFVVDRTEFEETYTDFLKAMEPHRGDPAAENYIRVVRQFKETAQARNSQILYRDALVGRLYELLSDQIEAQAESTEQRKLLQVSIDENLMTHAAYMESTSRRARRSLLRSLVMERRAIGYFQPGFDTSVGDLSDATIEHLEAIHADHLFTIAQAMISRNAAPQKFSSETDIILNRIDEPELFSTFETTGDFIFTIPPEHPAFERLALVYVNGISVSLDLESPIIHPLRIALVHMGDASVVDRDGIVHSFKHTKRSSILYFAPDILTATVSLGADAENYEMVSPFSTWRLNVRSVDMDRIPLHSLRGISIGFAGKAYSLFE